MPARDVSLPVRIVRFYLDGFRRMRLGRTLWLIILLKLFIMWAVLKLFFFPDHMAGKSPTERRDYVMEQLTDRQYDPL